MKMKLFCVFLFALTAEIAAANSNSISNRYLEPVAIANKDSVALDNAFLKVLRDDTYNQNQSEFRLLIASSNIKLSMNNRQ